MANLTETMRVSIPDAEADGMAVWRFTVGDMYGGKFRDMLEGRAISPGSYTGLFEHTGRLSDRGAGRRGWSVWMSDTPAELCDLLEPLVEVISRKARRVLINGLGLGCLLKGCLAVPSVEHVDVVEISENVIRLVSPAYADPRVSIIHADAHKPGLFPRGTQWDVAWHDIWPSGDEQYRQSLTRLMRSYARRAGWQGAWAHHQILGR